MYVTIQQAREACGRKNINVATGVTKNDQTLSVKPFTLPCHNMSRMNHTTVACFFNYAMHTLWLLEM